MRENVPKLNQKTKSHVAYFVVHDLDARIIGPSILFHQQLESPPSVWMKQKVVASAVQKP